MKTGPESPVTRAKRGERAAFGELWRAHQTAVLRYLRSRRTVDAEDVASQVWIDVASSIARFEGDADDFRRWLFTIAHRRSVDSIRRSVRADALALRSADATTRASDAAPGADADLEDATSLDRAISLIASLPDQMGAAVMLRVVNDLPVADVAEILGISEGNVRVLVHRGLTRLKRKIAVTPGASVAMEVVT